MPRPRLLALTLGPALALACFVDDPRAAGTAGATSTSTGAETSATATTGDGATTTTGAATTGATEGGTTTAGDPLEALLDGCKVYCEQAIACGQRLDETCPAVCVYFLTGGSDPPPGCVAAALDTLACLDGLSCRELMDPSTACPADYAQLQEACPPCEATTAMRGGACTATLSCPRDLHEASCTAALCKCSRNGVDTGLSCVPGVDPCAGTEQALIDQARSCCEWPP